jgi:hypothetical protein
VIALAVAMLAAFLQREFISAVSGRDGVRSLLAERTTEADPELSMAAALRGDARYYLRQLRRRQPEPDIERKRLAALAGVAIAAGSIAWLLWGPA